MKKRYNPLRVKLDLTQQELAHFLQLPLSTVAMCERGKRTWPSKGLLRLARLELAWVAAENLQVKETSLVPELVEAIGNLKHRMKECLETAGLLQRKLDSMKTRSLLLKTKEKTLQLLSEPGTSSIHQGWIEIQQYEIGKPLAENSLAKQIMIEHKVQTLQAEAAAAAATIERLEQQMGEEPLNTAVEEGPKTVMHDVPVESALPIQPVFQATTEAQLLQKPDRVVSSDLTISVEPPGFDLHLKTNDHRTQFHRTTSIGTTARRRLLQRNLPRRLFHAAGEKSLLPRDSGLKRGGLSVENITAAALTVASDRKAANTKTGYRCIFRLESGCKS
jgi:DNA-binding XRE family transcriptional regulator